MFDRFGAAFNKAFYTGRLLLLSGELSDKATTMIGDIGFNVDGMAPVALDILKGREGTGNASDRQAMDKN